MNLSGEASGPLLRFFKIETENTLVVYDELDLDPGVIRIRQGGSAAGHKGVSDMATHLSDTNFYRIRVGIGHPRKLLLNDDLSENTEESSKNQRLKPKRPIDVSAWVLGRPRPEDKELLGHAVCDSADAVEVLLESGLEEAQGKFHRKSPPV